MNEFQQILEQDKQLIDKRIADVSGELLAEVKATYGERYADVFEAYTDVLARGGKRLRGILAKRAYTFFGGTDEKVALDATIIIELLHDYLLVIDDIEDVSELRRGKPAAHILLKSYHQKHQLAGNDAHYGISQAINAALIGQNYAQLKTLELPVSDKAKLTALTHLNDFLIKTDFGQLGDFNNEAFRTENSEDAMQVMRLKTAYYTYCMPVYFGAALAGVDSLEPALDDFLVNAGISFQIYDDIIGTFGEVSKTGKSNKSDIIEGKRTLLITYALETATSAQRATLLNALGKSDLNDAEFEAARSVIRDTGALSRCQAKVDELTTKAINSLHSTAKTPPEAISFLESLALHVAGNTKI